LFFLLFIGLSDYCFIVNPINYLYKLYRFDKVIAHENAHKKETEPCKAQPLNKSRSIMLNQQYGIKQQKKSPAASGRAQAVDN
jgi:hypothetical protein